MDKIKQNREFIVRYFNAVSGEIKTEELCREYMTDEVLLEHIIFFEGAFPKYELFIDEMIAEDDKVLIRGRLNGVHKAEFNGIPPTNNKMDLPFVIRYTINDDKIVDHWLMADQVLLMKQLGIYDSAEKQPT